MPNEEYRICLGTRDLNPSTEEVVNRWAREGFKVYAVDNLGCIHMKREVDELTAPPATIGEHAPQMTVVDTPLVRSAALTEQEQVLYSMLQRDARLEDAVYRYPAHLVNEIYHLVERLLMQVQSPPTPANGQLRDEVERLTEEVVRLSDSLLECQMRFADAPIGLMLGDVDRSLVAAARSNWRDGNARYQDVTNLLDIVRRLTGVTT